MSLVTLGLSHHHAPVEARERLSFTESDLPHALERLRALPGVQEAAILSTCNRTEIMVVAAPDEEQRLLEWWRRERQVPEGYIEKYAYTHRDQSSVTHSLRVAAGLDSLVVGEPQILGQMKQSFSLARELHALGPILARLFQHAFAVAKLVRSQTEVGAHPVSVAYAALQMARRIFADMHNQTALLVGAGETIRLFGQHLHQHGIGRIVIANRSLERAQKLAQELGGYAVSLSDLPTYLGQADLIVSSTAARDHIIGLDLMQRVVQSRRRKAVFMIDLAVPRDIDPQIADIEDIYLYTVDDLRGVIAQNMKLREAAAQQAEGLVKAQAHEFSHWLESRDAAATIYAIRARARADRDAVLAKARGRLARGESPEAVMEFVANTLSNKILHAPSQTLRQADSVDQAMLLNAAQRLFQLPDHD
ncbi:glutamyl-tRNA reductase [Sinimarinibacterium sp. NLF-5-8]|uniref:glutamyl-tRNA reductase n=1 Tax=Sinimarinibacterium sp. NLF-5-8 TaxID=2698684 RepID=UPI00137BDFB5|nr:glutamyl-tRNA reductase [Sinimarinibacterium sp. NLF-5-8]QHS10184.1 glutamyl-tRNA reductase [Sinimarinibacterium sp. NLF-5-8]